MEGKDSDIETERPIERARSLSELTEEDNLRVALILKEEAKDLFDRSDFTHALTRYEDALIDLEKGLFRPKPGTKWMETQMQLTYGTVQCLTMLKEHARATSLCRSYLSANPNNIVLRLAFATVLAETQEYDDALVELRNVRTRQALTVSPGNNSILTKIDAISKLKVQQLTSERQRTPWVKKVGPWWLFIGLLVLLVFVLRKMRRVRKF